MADVAVEFQQSPAAVRSWSWVDFVAVLTVYRRRSENAKNRG